MTLMIKNRVRESSSTQGSGTITLAGALTNYQSFSDAVGTGNTCKYSIVNQNANEWEVGTGAITVADGITYLARTSIEESSNSDAVVTLTAGTKLVTLVYTADQLSNTGFSLADVSGTGILVKNTSSTAVARAVSVSPALSVTNGSGVSGDILLGVNAELSADSVVSTTGFIVRTGAGARATRSVVVSSPLSITDGDGVAASPNIVIVSSQMKTFLGLGTAAYANVGSSATALPDVSIADARYYFLTSGQAVASVATVLSAAITSVGVIAANAITTVTSITNLPSITGGVATPNYVDFDTTPTGSGAVGRLIWNTTDGTLNLGMIGGNVTQQIGQESFVYARNTSGSTMLNGKVARLVGSTGSRATIALANVSDSENTIGILTEDIANNTEGFVTTFGLVRDLDTSSFTEGAQLYLSNSTPGDLTETKPSGVGSVIVRVALCVRSHPTLGSLLLTSPRVDNGFQVLTNVSGTGILIKTTASTTAVRRVSVAPALSVVNADGVSGDPTIGVNAELSADSVVSTTGFLVRTGAGARATRTLTAGTYITISNGSGVSGDPVVSADISALDLRYAALSASQTFTGNNTFSVTVATSGLYHRGAAFSPLATLTDGASIAVDMSRGVNFVVTLGGNRTLEAPTNVQPGQSGFIYIAQDATGSRTLSYNSVWKFAAGTAPTLTTTASARDILAYSVFTSALIDGALTANLS